MALAGKTKQDVLSEFRTAEILQAARKVFAEKGFNETTVDEIAAAAGIAKGTVYLYFPGKRELYIAALNEGKAELRRQTTENMRLAQGLREKLRTFSLTRLEYADANRDFIRIYHSEFGNLGKASPMDSEFQQWHLGVAEELESVLREGLQRGEIRNVRTDFAAFVIYDIVRSVMVQRLLARSKVTIAEDVQAIDDFVWKGLAPA
jgi:AcrR family transcriptional regulator